MFLLQAILAAFYAPVPFASLSKYSGGDLHTSRLYSNSASIDYGDCLQYPHSRNGQHG